MQDIAKPFHISQNAAFSAERSGINFYIRIVVADTRWKFYIRWIIIRFNLPKISIQIPIEFWEIILLSHRILNPVNNFVFINAKSSI